MANPTSAFGWQMPTSSDLVTDLPADFETFGQAVDASLADLKGGTTGQVLSKASGTDMDFTWVGGAWSTWTPSFFNFTAGNATITARYQQIGKTVDFAIRVDLGSTSSVTGAIGVSLPANNKQNGVTVNAFIQDTGVGLFTAFGEFFDNYVYLRAYGTGGTYGTNVPVSATIPMTWNNTDSFVLNGSYEVA